MTSIIKLHTISGAKNESPPCYILQIDDFKLLLDCGWDEFFNADYIKELRKHVNTIDAVLLSYPDVYHLGALPYLVGKLGLSCPIYSTIPIYKMGQMFMYDLHQSHHNMSDFDIFSLDDVDAAFDKIIQLKYNQTISMKGKGYGISITPLPAGHMIGGTIWKIKKQGEEDIIYANDFNHKKERHLNGCELEKLQRPSLLIIDSFNTLYQQERRRGRDEKLMTNILQTLRKNGNVLICIDTAGRVLELAHMLDQLWRNKESGLNHYSLALLNNVCYNVVEFAKLQIEWMSDKLMKAFEGVRNNPFQFKHLQLCHSMSELSKVRSPKVVLASSPDLECGFSRELFVQWAQNENNSIILTSRTAPGTLARDLIENGGNRKLDLSIKRRVRLEGAELDEYERQKIELEKEEKELSESEDELEMYVISKGKHDIVVKHEQKPLHGGGGVNNAQTGGFFKQVKKQHAMFPFAEDKIKCDEYGEIIRPEDYNIVEPMQLFALNDSNTIDLDQMDVNNSNNQMEEEIVEDIPEIPSKCVEQMRGIDVKAQIQYIDFEGRSDGESLLKILTQLRPRSVIVVRGNEAATKTLAEHCEKKVGARVFTPSIGEVIDATTESHIYQVTLTDALVSQFDFIKTKENLEVAWLCAKSIYKLKSQDTKQQGSDERMDCNPDISDDRMALTFEQPTSDEIPAHNMTFINDIKLLEFKQILNRHNIQSEFDSGILWCANGTLALRKNNIGKILIEGCHSDDYYKVKNILYQQYALV